jgi:hypothetical protein
MRLPMWPAFLKNTSQPRLRMPLINTIANETSRQAGHFSPSHGS